MFTNSYVLSGKIIERISGSIMKTSTINFSGSLDNLDKELEKLSYKLTGRIKSDGFIAQQGQQAKADMERAEKERLELEKQMDAKFAKLKAEQEAARKKEQDAISREKDAVKKAQLENERYWNEVARKSALKQDSWQSVDNTQSLIKAKQDVIYIKKEIARLNQQMNLQSVTAVRKLKTAYNKQIDLIVSINISTAIEKDPFESDQEYQQRVKNQKNKIKLENKKPPAEQMVLF
jgi:hypothetical protein